MKKDLTSERKNNTKSKRPYSSNPNEKQQIRFGSSQINKPVINKRDS